MEPEAPLSRRFWLWLALGIGAGIVLAVGVVGACLSHVLPLLNPDWDAELARAWKSVETGMTREQVVGLLGEPEEQSAEFHLGQYGGFEAVYKRAASSGSEYYLFWDQGIDVVYAVGFDERDKVTFKAAGGT